MLLAYLAESSLANRVIEVISNAHSSWFFIINADVSSNYIYFFFYFNQLSDIISSQFGIKYLILPEDSFDKIKLAANLEQLA